MLLKEGLCMPSLRVELVEVYTVGDSKRYRFKIVGTNLFINVEASSINEAVSKAYEIIRKLKISKEIIEHIKEGVKKVGK